MSGTLNFEQRYTIGFEATLIVCPRRCSSQLWPQLHEELGDNPSGKDKGWWWAAKAEELGAGESSNKVKDQGFGPRDIRRSADVE